MRTRRTFLINSALFLLLAALPAGAKASSLAPRAARRRVLNVPALMLHRIAPSSEAGTSIPDLVISPARFEAQMSALKRDGWTTVTAATLASHIESGDPLPSKSMVITIDDGRDDGYTYAFPILQGLGFVATYYVITGRVGLAHYLSVPQLQEMAAAGMEIANHSVHHLGISGRSTAYINNEVQGAQDQLTALLGAPPVTFAYPFGEHPPKFELAVKNAGLKLAFTTVNGRAHSRSTALAAPRIRVSPGITPRAIVKLLDRS